MNNFTEQIKKQIMELGADFVGVSNRQRFAEAPPNTNPDNIMPDYQSVISFGIVMSMGCLEAWFSKRSRRPQDDYDMRARGHIDDISFNLTRLLEREGYPSSYIKENGYFNDYNEFKPDFSHKHAAVAAGLGIIGLSNLLVHPRYGAAVHIGSVITKASLEADPMLDADDNPCDNCGYCVQICPVKAINPKKTTGFTIDGKEYNHTKHNKIKCMYGCCGYTGHEYQIGNKKVGTWSFNHRPVSNAEEIIKNMHEPDNDVRHPMELAEKVIDPELQWCGNCHKICVGNRKQKDTLFKLHLNSGRVEIPDDSTRLLKLRDKNYKVMPFDFKKNGYDYDNIKPKWDDD
jgi:epoxyqueuosine reductase